MNTNELKLYFNAPGLRSQQIDIAPVVDVSPSKRKPLIDKEVDYSFPYVSPLALYLDAEIIHFYIIVYV
ncbi:hypothetical protein EON65_24725 [archaeon]|nr:MAG: hypothetical protein EON65_24725 [archaeon]